jgi:hypothetical protein
VVTAESALLKLESPRWAELNHAYGSAADVPELLVALADLPNAVGQAEPWFSLWSSLAHQGDVYPASFAAVPHVVEALARDPARAGSTYFHFPAWVEICRVRKGLTAPDDLRAPYFAALARLPGLAAAAAAAPWDDDRLACVLSAIAAAKGHCEIAETVIELSDTSAYGVLEWIREQ